MISNRVVFARCNRLACLDRRTSSWIPKVVIGVTTNGEYRCISHSPNSSISNNDDVTIRKALRLALPKMLPRPEAGVVHQLAELNGYRRVHFTPEEFVPLAEGVLAEPFNRKTFDKQYKVYAKPSVVIKPEKKKEKDAILSSYILSFGRGQPEEKPPEVQHPPFREEDFSLFKIVQSSVEEDLNNLEERLKAYIRSKADQLQQTYDHYHSVIYKIYAPVANLFRGSSEQLAEELNSKDDEQDQSPMDDGTVTKVVPYGSNEDIVVCAVEEKEIILLKDVPPEYRLLTLPTKAYRLRHGRAATIIYTALVSFAAVPLAYRSLKYAMDYPYLAQALVASVVASVSYSLWSWRDGARTRQLLVVKTAVGSRLVAKDEAALLVLQDGATTWTETLIEAIIAEYFARRKDASRNDTVRAAKMTQAAEAALQRGLLSHDGSIYSAALQAEPRSVEKVEALGHPAKVALELGLLKRNESEKLVAVEFDDIKILQQ